MSRGGSPLDRIARLPVRAARAALRRTPGVSHFLRWTDPLHTARRLLYQALAARAHYARGWLLDVGCGKKPYRRLFSHVDQYIGIDLPPIRSDLPPVRRVDVRADGLALPFAAGAFDTVLCNEVLEHVPEPRILMAEAFRVLRPGGCLLLSTPQTWGLHHEPHDYYRYTRYGLAHLAESAGFTVVEVIPTSGMWATVAQRVADTVIYTYAVGKPRALVNLLALVLAPVQLIGAGLDWLFGKRGDTLDNVLVAKRPGESQESVHHGS